MFRVLITWIPSLELTRYAPRINELEKLFFTSLVLWVHVFKPILRIQDI